MLDFYVLAGGSVKPGPERRGIYKKGETILIDNLMMDKREIWQDWLKPGRLVTAHTRRSRWTPDMFVINSDEPIGWGVVESVDGNRVTMVAPNIDSKHTFPRGKQTVTLDDTVDYYYLGQKISKSKALGKGSLVRVYPARPQTILVSKK